MFNFSTTTSTCGTTVASLIEGDITGVFCFMNKDCGLDTCGGILVAGEAVRTNFTQYYAGDLKCHGFDTDDFRVY